MTPRDLLHLAAPLLVGQGWRFSEELATLLGFEPGSRTGIGRAASGEREVSPLMLERLQAALIERRSQIDLAICSLSEHIGGKSLQDSDLLDETKSGKPLDADRAWQHNDAMVKGKDARPGRETR